MIKFIDVWLDPVQAPRLPKGIVKYKLASGAEGIRDAKDLHWFNHTKKFHSWTVVAYQLPYAEHADVYLTDHQQEAQRKYDAYRQEDPGYWPNTSEIGTPMISDTKAEDGKEKTPLHWLPPLVLKQVADLMIPGGKKYYPHKWKKEPTSPMARVASAKRHILDWEMGKDNDVEMLVNNLDCAILQLMMAKHYINEGLKTERIYGE